MSGWPVDRPPTGHFSRDRYREAVRHQISIDRNIAPSPTQPVNTPTSAKSRAVALERTAKTAAEPRTPYHQPEGTMADRVQEALQSIPAAISGEE